LVMDIVQLGQLTTTCKSFDRILKKRLDEERARLRKIAKFGTNDLTAPQLLGFLEALRRYAQSRNPSSDEPLRRKERRWAVTPDREVLPNVIDSPSLDLRMRLKCILFHRVYFPFGQISNFVKSLNSRALYVTIPVGSVLFKMTWNETLDVVGGAVLDAANAASFATPLHLFYRSDAYNNAMEGLDIIDGAEVNRHWSFINITIRSPYSNAHLDWLRVRFIVLPAEA
jgi:hypothetical protein